MTGSTLLIQIQNPAYPTQWPFSSILALPSVLFLGEFEFMNIPMSSSPMEILEWLFFFGFVFPIPLVLMMEFWTCIIGVLCTIFISSYPICLTITSALSYLLHLSSARWRDVPWLNNTEIIKEEGPVELSHEKFYHMQKIKQTAFITDNGKVI